MERAAFVCVLLSGDNLSLTSTRCDWWATGTGGWRGEGEFGGRGQEMAGKTYCVRFGT